MADASRARTAILNLFANNTTEEISPQDLRDFVVTVMGTYGAILIDGTDNTVPTTQSGIGTSPTVVTGWANDGKNGLGENCTPDSANNKITATVTGIYLILCQLSFSGTASTEFDFEIYINGTASGYRCSRLLGGGGDVGSCSVLAIANVSATQDIEVYVNADGASKAIAIQDAQLAIKLIA